MGPTFSLHRATARGPLVGQASAWLQPIKASGARPYKVTDSSGIPTPDPSTPIFRRDIKAQPCVVAGFQRHFQSTVPRGIAESIVGFQDLVQGETMSHQLARLKAAGLKCFHQHWCCDCVTQSRGQSRCYGPRVFLYAEPPACRGPLYWRGGLRLRRCPGRYRTSPVGRQLQWRRRHPRRESVP